MTISAVRREWRLFRRHLAFEWARFRNIERAVAAKVTDILGQVMRVVIYLTVIALGPLLLYALFPSEAVNETFNKPLASLTLGALVGVASFLFLWGVLFWVLTSPAEALFDPSDDPKVRRRWVDWGLTFAVIIWGIWYLRTH